MWEPQGMKIVMPIDLLDSCSRRFWRFLECYFNIPLLCFFNCCMSFCSIGQFDYCTIWSVCLSFCTVCPFFLSTSLLRRNPILLIFGGYYFNISCNLYGNILCIICFWFSYIFWLFMFLVVFHCFWIILLFFQLQNIQIIWGVGVCGRF